LTKEKFLNKNKNVNIWKVKRLDELTEKIKAWAIERNIHDADPHRQILKLGEEFGELCQAIAKNRNLSDIEKEIGDVYVVLTILSMQLNTDIEKCIAMTYKKIQNRRGEMVNGVYVKESDL
jgi:NTP pyrophosphatase (non-canonical NTP hydrolase)